MRKAKSIVALIVACAAFAVLAVTACTPSQVQESIDVAAQVSGSAAGILRPVDPAAAEALAQAGNDLKLAGSLYAAYQAAAPADKPAVAARIQATLGAISDNMPVVLNAVHIKNPQLEQYITVGVAVINTAVQMILQHVTVPNTSSSVYVAMKSAQLPVVNGAKSAKDLKKAWNDACTPNYPNSRI